LAGFGNFWEFWDKSVGVSLGNVSGSVSGFNSSSVGLNVFALSSEESEEFSEALNLGGGGSVDLGLKGS
jgi:hypothetical protein